MGISSPKLGIMGKKFSRVLKCPQSVATLLCWPGFLSRDTPHWWQMDDWIWFIHQKIWNLLL